MMIDKKMSLSVIQELREDVKLQWQKTKDAHKELISNVKERVTDEDMEWINNNRKNYQDIVLKICSYCDCIKENEERIRNEIAANKFRMERMKMPKFDGNIREYSKFKSDFTKQVLPQLPESSAAYVLTTCLEGNPLDIAKTVDDDIKMIWNRLDEIYGRPSKLTDVIMSEIKGLKPITDNDDKRFLNLVNTVERGYRNLTRLKMEREI